MPGQRTSSPTPRRTPSSRWTPVPRDERGRQRQRLQDRHPQSAHRVFASRNRAPMSSLKGSPWITIRCTPIPRASSPEIFIRIRCQPAKNPPSNSAWMTAIPHRPTPITWIQMPRLHAERWGTIMNTNYPGRGAEPDRHTIYIYTNVVGTTEPGVFMVTIPNSTSIQTIKAGDFWCMVSPLERFQCLQCGELLSDHLSQPGPTTPGRKPPIFQASATPLVNEINCHVEIGPPPPGATRSAHQIQQRRRHRYFGNTRIGPWVENCVFTGLSDDVANAYTEPFVITNTLAHAHQPFFTVAIQYRKTRRSGRPPPPLMNCGSVISCVFLTPLPGPFSTGRSSPTPPCRSSVWTIRFRGSKKAPTRPIRSCSTTASIRPPFT